MSMISKQNLIDVFNPLFDAMERGFYILISISSFRKACCYWEIDEVRVMCFIEAIKRRYNRGKHTFRVVVRHFRKLR